jgi:hypothetical protein
MEGRQPASNKTEKEGPGKRKKDGKAGGEELGVHVVNAGHFFFISHPREIERWARFLGSIAQLLEMLLDLNL